MSAREFGPVELVAIAFDSDRIPENVIHAIKKVPKHVATLLDVTVVTVGEDGTRQLLEYEAAQHRHGLPDLELDSIGIEAEEDALELASELPAGSSALVVAFEQTWLRDIVTVLDDSGGEILADARIPAAVVNEIADLAAIADEESQS